LRGKEKINEGRKERRKEWWDGKGEVKMLQEYFDICS